MDTKDIPEQLAQLHSMLVDKIGGQPFIPASLSIGSNGKCAISLYDQLAVSTEMMKFISEDTVEGALKVARSFVEAMPDHDARDKHDWHHKLANVIDEGHALALPDEVMNPLRQGSKAMHKNLLAAPD